MFRFHHLQLNPPFLVSISKSTLYYRVYLQHLRCQGPLFLPLLDGHFSAHLHTVQFL